MDTLLNFETLSSSLFTSENLAKLIRVSLLLFIGIPVIMISAKKIRQVASDRISPQQGMVISKVFLYLSVLIITIMVMSELKFKLSTLLGAAGIFGIAIGFASQTSVSNIISGLFLIMEKPFQVNDIITIGSTTGIVQSIDMLSVKLRTFDNKFVRIPNESIIKTEVTNITRFPIRRVDIQIGVAYKENIGRVREVLLDLALKNPLCLNEPEPLVIFSGFGSSSLDLLFMVWAEKTAWLQLKNTLSEEIKESFDEKGIEIPFPHLSLYTGSLTQPLPITITNTSEKNPS